MVVTKYYYFLITNKLRELPLLSKVRYRFKAYLWINVIDDILGLKSSFGLILKFVLF